MTKSAVVCIAFLAATQMGFGQLLQLQSIDVDSNGNLLQVGWNNTVTGTKLDASAAQGATGYLGGVFNQVNTSIFLQSNNQYYITNLQNGIFQGFSPVTGLPAFPGTLTANNVVKLVYVPSTKTLQISALTLGYGGNGVNGEVLALTLSCVGDLYAGGTFTAAGGFPYSSGIGVYLASGGWQNSYIFSAFDSVSAFSWIGGKLKVTGSHLWQVDGPVYPHDHNSDHINVSNNTAYWNTSYCAFEGGYWSAQ